MRHIVLYFTVLYCIVLYCIVLYCTVMYCIVLYCTVLYYIALYCNVMYCIVLYCTLLYCIALYCTILYCIVLYFCWVQQCSVQNWIYKVKRFFYEEIDELIKHKNIVNCIKAQRLSWFGHVQRMPDTRTVKKIFKWKLLTKRSQRRTKYRWEDSIKQDICQMKIKNWIACVQDRWK